MFEGHRLNPNEFMNFEQVAVLYKKTAIRGPCAFVSNSLRLSKIPPTLTPFLYSNVMGISPVAKSITMDNRSNPGYCL